MTKSVKELGRRFPDDQRSRQMVTIVVQEAFQGARTEEVRRELEEALEEAGAPA